VDITLNLTVEETNVVLVSLGQMPYVQVNTLILKIQAQAQAQVEAAKASE
jgi:hypothetical protein